MIATEIILGIGNYFSFLSCDRCIRYEQQQRSLMYILRKRDSSRNFVRSVAAAVLCILNQRSGTFVCSTKWRTTIPIRETRYKNGKC